jgi:hypothetical protein
MTIPGAPYRAIASVNASMQKSGVILLTFG